MPLNVYPVWRFIPLLDASGELQMAIDSWLLKQHREKNHPPCLRFYTWNPPAISLGVSQKRHIPNHWYNIDYHGQLLQVVKRPSGGRGVLHQGDLTYSVITSCSQGSVAEIYGEISQFLITGWQELGVSLSLGKPKQPYLQSANCFSLATNADLIDSEGNKFIGSAQLRQGNFVLQHGSMLLRCDRTLYQKVFNSSPPLVKIPEDLLLSEIVETLVKAAGDCFQCDFEIQPLSAREIEEVRELMNT